MKRLIPFIFLFLAFDGKAQLDENEKGVIESYRRIAQLIKYDSIEKLASLVEYPLNRRNPVPNINSAKEFISYYDTLFDKEFKQKVIKLDSSDIFQHDGNYGLFNGDIWITEEGKIIAINHSSDKEKQLSQKLTNEIKAKMYKGIMPWKRNIIVCKSEKFLIRIDDINGHDSLRYISWGKGKQISDKPDLILFGGTYEFQGTQGGITYTFKSGEWEYVIDEVWICEDDRPDLCGTFLRVIHNGKEVESYKCEKTK